MLNIETYFPRNVRLGDGTMAELRLMTGDDFHGLLEFFRGLPAGDRLFMKDDVTDREVIERWCREIDYDRIIPILAVHEGRIIGDATLHMEKEGWEKDVGEIRISIAKDYQGRSLGKILAGEIFHIAVEKGLIKMQAKLLAGQEAAAAAFEALGFRREAVLKDHVRDLEGKRHDLVIMTNSVKELWDRLEEFIRGHECPREDIY